MATAKVQVIVRDAPGAVRSTKFLQELTSTGAPVSEPASEPPPESEAAAPSPVFPLLLPVSSLEHAVTRPAPSNATEDTIPTQRMKPPAQAIEALGIAAS
jgi:hypothetical protein